MKYNKKIISVMVVICVMFLSLALYLTHFTLFKAEETVDNKYNKRIREREEQVLRGTIYDRNGEILAYSKIENNSQTRYYPYNERYAHVIGYNSVTYSKSALESTYNEYLTKTDPIDDLSLAFFKGDKEPKGADLHLTIDNDLTGRAQELMAGKNGSVVALNPVTGEVLCLYSNPTFDTNEASLAKSFGELTQSQDHPFVARSTQGLYAPGSTFKIITAVAALEEGCAVDVEDKGKITIDGYEIKNFEEKENGVINIKEGFSKSSNVMFATYGTAIGEKKLEAVAKRFLIGEEIPFDILTSKSMFSPSGKMGQTDVAATAIGQGKLLVSPLNMALVASGVANDGIIMEPYIVESASYGNAKTVYEKKPKVLREAVSDIVAETITEYMTDCVQNGTGKGAYSETVTIAGKTGTAENEKEGKEHAWFVCFAPAENPVIAICIVQEYAGKTGSSCTPIAKELIEYYLQR